MTECDFEFCKHIPMFGVSGADVTRCEQHREEGMITDPLLFRTHNPSSNGYTSYANTVGHAFASECMFVKDTVRSDPPRQDERQDGHRERQDGHRGKGERFRRVGRTGKEEGKGNRQGKNRTYTSADSRYGR